MLTKGGVGARWGVGVLFGLIVLDGGARVTTLLLEVVLLGLWGGGLHFYGFNTSEGVLRYQFCYLR